ncbi:hypothetical protein D6817_03440 [Candidatus Pacearchaeota archaeon]|nr:MAG: hypothetical protein D6817_03440 [Candidatus Pacearchaeota archaeon]
MKSENAQGFAERESRVPACWQNWTCTLPLLGAIMTLVPAILTMLVWRKFPGLEIPIPQTDKLFFLINDLNARTFWVVSGLITVVCALVVIVSAAWVIHQSAKERPKLHRAIVLTFPLLILTTVSILLQTELGGYSDKLLESFLLQISELEVEYKITTLSLSAIADYDSSILNVLKMVSIGMLVAGFVTVLYTPNVTKFSVHEVRLQQKHLSLLLYTGTAVLIAGVIATYAFVRVPMVFLDGNTTVLKYMNEFAATITTAYGLLFTLCLAGTYLPTSLVVSARARRLAYSAGKKEPEFDSQTWLKEQGLATSHFQYIGQAVAVLAPFLVSLSQLVGKFL